MSIKKEASGFFEWHSTLKGVSGLGVESDMIDECIDYYHEHGGFGRLFGNPAFGFKQDNLDFLTRTRNVKWLWFWDVALRNIDPI